MTRNPWYIGQGGCVRGKFIWNIEEISKGDMKCGRRDTDMWLKGVDPKSDAVELGWIKSVRKEWRINQDPELAHGV